MAYECVEGKDPLILNLRMKFICLEFQASAVPGKISPNTHKKKKLGGQD